MRGYARGVNATELALVEERLAELGFRVDEPGPEWGVPPSVDLVASPRSAPRVTIGVCQGDSPSLPKWGLAPRQHADAMILALRRVTPAVAERLRAAGQGYIDTSGNAWIQAPGVHVRVEGRPLDPRLRAEPHGASGWALRPSGLQVLFALLTLPALIEARLVDIATAAGVSTATAHHVMRDLIARGWVDDREGHRLWLDRHAAGRAWFHDYVSRIAPMRDAHRYVVREPMTAQQWVAACAEADQPAWVTDAAALDALGHGLRSHDVALYAASPYRPPTGVRIARAKAGQDAALVVYEPWWDPSGYPPGVVPALLVCADAIASGEPRAMTVAREVMADDPDLRPLLTT